MGYSVRMIDGVLAPFIALGAVAAAAVLWLQYWNLKDHLKPEPRRLLLAAFVAGLAAAGVALGLFRVAGWLGLPIEPGGTSATVAVFCFAVVGPVEEGAKFAAARLVPFRFREFDETIDGLVYGAAVALGFASVENLLYLPMLPPAEGILRTIASPLTHSLFAAVWAVPTARVLIHKTSRAKRWTVQIVALGVAAGLHGAYDWLVIAHQATIPAAGVVAVLWFAVIFGARRLLRPGAGS